MADLVEIPWRACDLGEGGWDGETPFCSEPCSGCHVLAQIELAKVSTQAELAEWQEIAAVTRG